MRAALTRRVGILGPGVEMGASDGEPATVEA
jgi:hypothetical protein